MLIQVANFFARNSLSKWNRCRLLRVCCRKMYQLMGSFALFWRKVHRRSTTVASSTMQPEQGTCGNTYPWPYCEEDFANWEFSDASGEYTLVCDPAGFVVKHCTSYCAWKIRELTGRWPTKRRAGVTYHAKKWQGFLVENGFTAVVESPEQDAEKHYIGIDSSRGVYGQVYWYEQMGYERQCLVSAERSHSFVIPMVECTTYVDGRFARITLGMGMARRLTWVQLD